MDIYGLIGKNLEHSFSPEYMNRHFQKHGIDAEYRLFELNTPEEFPELIANNTDLVGLNVTIPYKRSLGQYIHSLDKPSNLTGAINTIKIIRQNNKTNLIGYNTDVIGFEKTIKPILKNRRITKAIILGTGGSSNSVAYVLRRLGIVFSYVTRTPCKIMHTHYAWLDEKKIRDNLFIINTTPLGMFPDINDYPPIPYHFITDKHILYDLIYNPQETIFLKRGSEHGATCINGQQMLEIQANESLRIWRK